MLRPRRADQHRSRDRRGDGVTVTAFYDLAPLWPLAFVTAFIAITLWLGSGRPHPPWPFGDYAERIRVRLQCANDVFRALDEERTRLRAQYVDRGAFSLKAYTWEAQAEWEAVDARADAAERELRELGTRYVEIVRRKKMREFGRRVQVGNPRAGAKAAARAARAEQQRLEEEAKRCPACAVIHEPRRIVRGRGYVGVAGGCPISPPPPKAHAGLASTSADA